MAKERRGVHALAVDDVHDDARYRATFQHAAIGIAHTTFDGVLIDANPALCTMLGYALHELMRKRLPQGLLAREHDRTSAAPTDDEMRRLRAGEIGAVTRSEPYAHKTGRVVWVQRTVSLVSEKGLVPYLAHFVEDITARRHTDEARRVSDLRYQRTLESALECIVSIDGTGHIVEFNHMAEEVFGYTRAHVLGQRLFDVLLPPRVSNGYEVSIERLLSPDDRQSMLGQRIETVALRSDGGTVPVELMMQRITESDPPLFTAFLRDITERKAAEGRILRMNRLCRALSHMSALIMRTRDRGALFGGICRIAQQHGGLSGAWVGLVDSDTQTLRVEAHAGGEPMDSAEMPINVDGAKGQVPLGSAVQERRIVVWNDVRSDTVALPWQKRHRSSGVRALAVLPLTVAGDVIGVFVLEAPDPGYFDEDVEELLREMSDELSHALDRLRLEQKHQEAERRLAHLAHYDQLTSLPNRGLYYERLSHGIAQAARNDWTLAVIFLDLDRFKTVNETMGHSVGDSLLHQVATRLLECVRAEDTVSRLGGDEFGIVLGRLTDADDAGLVAAKLLKQMKEPYQIDGFDVVISASVGISLYPQDGDNADILMRNAGVAMYNAKARSDSYQFYTAEMNSRALAKLQLESRMRGALEREEFVLHYQPKVDILTGHICGFEALLRWQPPGEAIVAPGEFIPLLEETGMINPVGEWVVEAACAQIAAWRDAGCELVPIAINLSARQLGYGGFGDAVVRSLERHKIEARFIEIEITESSLIENLQDAQETLQELKAVGVSLAVDDFGTGHSALAYLKRFPLDTLKIDRSFVRDLGIDPDDAMIARMIIGLAASLGLTAVAEGVETQEQLGLLLANGCEQAQGFLFSRPVPAGQASEILKNRAPFYRPARRGPRTQNGG
jgi:diguanylate cyclase (GGDEF)-like protein/PAS domain S-box-containing protein